MEDILVPEIKDYEESAHGYTGSTSLMIITFATLSCNYIIHLLAIHEQMGSFLHHNPIMPDYTLLTEV